MTKANAQTVNGVRGHLTGVQTMYQVQGYDKLLGEVYIKPEVYSDYDEAKAICRTNESVIKVSA